MRVVLGFVLVSLTNCIIVEGLESLGKLNIDFDLESFIENGKQTEASYLKSKVEDIKNQNELERIKVDLLSRIFNSLLYNRRQIEFISTANNVDELLSTVIQGLQISIKRKIKLNSFGLSDVGKGTFRTTSISFIMFAENITETIVHMDNVGKILQGSEYGQDLYILIVSEQLSDNSIMDIAKRAWKHYRWFNFVVIFFTNISNQVNLNVNIHGAHRQDRTPIRKYVLHNNTCATKWIKPADYLSNRMNNLEGYQFRVTLDNYSWFSIPEYDEDGRIKKFTGKEGEVIHIYSQKLNYTPLYSLPLDGTVYGGAMPTGTIIGGVKDVNDGNSDLYGNGIIADSISPDFGVRPLRYIQQSQIVIIMPLPMINVQHIQTLLNVLQRPVVICTFTLYITVFVLWYCTKFFITNRKPKKEFLDLGSDIMVNMTGVLNSISIKIGNNSMERFLFFLLLYWALIMNSIYQGRIITGLTIQERENFNTLQDLTKSHYTIMCVTDLCEYLKPNEEIRSEIETRKELYKRIHVLKVPQLQTHIMAKYRNFSKIMPYFTALALKLVNFDSYGNDMLHIIEEPLGHTYMPLVVPKWSPVSVSLNAAQIQIATAGLNSYWTTYFKHKLRLRRYHTKVVIYEHPAINIENLKPIFVLWVFWLGLSCLVFILELMIGKWFKLIDISNKFKLI